MIQGFSAMEVDEMKKDDNEVSMGDKYEYDREQDTKEGSYTQVSPSSLEVSSTNHWFSQRGDVSRPIQLGPCANSTRRLSRQVNSYILYI
jgi:hypothetical protein